LLDDDILSQGSKDTEATPAAYTPDNAISHDGKYGTNDTAPETLFSQRTGVQPESDKKDPE
jgi:hypothetical protein